MPQSTMSAEDREFLIKQGLDPDQAVPVQEEAPEEMSKLGAAEAVAKGHAGGILGGGAGTIGGASLAALAAPWLLGPEAGIPADLLILGGGALAGAGGGYLGQKAQQKLQSNETNEQQEKELEQAQREHPYVSLATDIGASALASGGSPSIRTPLAALGGDAKALKSLAFNSIVNPAINSGINYAATGELPSGSELSAQALGGAFMSGSRNPLARLGGFHGRGEVVEPSDKNNVPPSNASSTLQLNAPKQPLALLGQGRRFLGGDEGGPITDLHADQAQIHPDLNNDNSISQTIAPEESLIDQSQRSPIATLDQRSVDFQKAKAEQVSQKYQEPAPTQEEPVKPLSANSLRIINPDTLLQSNIGRVENRNGEDHNLQQEEPGEDVSDIAQGRLEERGAIMPESPGARKIQDWVDYQEAGKRMQEAKEGSDEYIQAWKDREAVKNRNEGQTPTEPKRGLGSQMQEPNKEAGFFRLPSFLHKSAIENVEDMQHPIGKTLGKATRHLYQEARELRGQFINPAVESGKGMTKSDSARINQLMNEELSNKKAATLNPNDSEVVKNFYAKAKDILSKVADYAIANKIPVLDKGGSPRLMQKHDFYWPSMANQKVEDVFRKKTDQVAIKKLEDVFDHWNQHDLGMTPDESKARIANWKTAIQGNLRGSEVSHQDYFNAIRKEMGNPIPPEFREQNPVKNLTRYLDRFATAASFYKHIESNHDIMSHLGATKDPWGNEITPSPDGGIANNPDVQTLLKQFHHSPESNMDKQERSYSGLATAGLIAGPPLETHKIISNIVKAASFARNPMQVASMLTHGFTHLKEGYQHASENGLMKLTASSSKDMLDGTLSAAERLNGVARAIRQVSTLGDLTTKFNSGMIQAMMEAIVPSKIHNANMGNVTDQKFMQRIDPDYVVGKKYTTEEIKKFSSVAAEYVHGTGDARQMPGWMLNDSEVSGFFHLAHWSIAQTNNFVHDILEPAQRGDLTPLLTSVFGAAIGGYLIKEVRQQMTGKKGPIPSLQEIQAGEGGLAAHKSLLAYNAIAAMQYSGFGGLLSQLAKYPFDFAYKNRPQGATFPLDELASDLAGTLKDVSSTIANDPNLNWIDLAKAVTQHTLQNNVMLSRIAINQGINSGLITGLPAEKKELSDRMNQLRRFDMVEGLPYGDIDEGSNPYMNIEQKKFKYSQNPQEAVQMLPSLINGIMTTYAGKPDVIMSKLQGLKQNQFSTFPSMEHMPIESMKYFGYLERLKGPEEAQAELMDYMKHHAINSAKSAAVP